MKRIDTIHSQKEYAREETLQDGQIINVHINNMESIFAKLRSVLKFRSRRTTKSLNIMLKKFMYEYAGYPKYDIFRFFAPVQKGFIK
jgi:hypothetical protein